MYTTYYYDYIEITTIINYVDNCMFTNNFIYALLIQYILIDSLIYYCMWNFKQRTAIGTENLNFHVLKIFRELEGIRSYS